MSQTPYTRYSVACVALLVALLALADPAQGKGTPVTCASVRCSANAQCVAHKNGSLACECKRGYFKADNGTCISPCATVRCATNRVCEASEESAATCVCKAPYYVVGSECKDRCLSTKCPGGTTCKVVGSKVKCVCPKGQTLNGTKCVPKKTGGGGSGGSGGSSGGGSGGSGNKDPCAAARCASPSKCVPVNGKATCSCPPPLVSRRHKCIDLCAAVKCPTHAVCRPADYRGTCFCQEPYVMRKGKCATS